MKALLVLALSLFISTTAFAEITCASKPAASCLADDGLCMEFFAESGSDEEVWEGLCDSSEGTYSDAPCDKAQVAAKCLIGNNPMMPVINFLKTDFTTEDATFTCSMMQGKVCE